MLDINYYYVTRIHVINCYVFRLCFMHILLKPVNNKTNYRITFQ